MSRGVTPKSSTPEPSGEQELLSSDDVARTIARIAHQIIEKTSVGDSGTSPPILLGIRTRGVPLAARLADRIRVFSGVEVPVGSLDITLYRDDLWRKPPRALEQTELPTGVDDRVVILVDDVLFSGRTVRAGLDALRDLGRPTSTQLAVLIDRGHRDLPIRADYVGKNIPTARNDDVAVLMSEVDGRDAVVLRRVRGDQ